ncbi:hypothetical protein F66182_6449 [Fusarium sp. NRRL 66182]|nr:hypothetical protein F66182_6449 [Fusarium sp. NRRL 66182]
MAEDPRPQLGVDPDGPEEGSDEPQNTSSLTIRRALYPTKQPYLVSGPRPTYTISYGQKGSQLVRSSERKIDIIDRRLEALTELMRDMKMNMQSPNPPRPNTTATAATATATTATTATAAAAATQHNTPGSDATRHSSAQPSGSTSYGHLAQLNADSPVIEGEFSLAAHGEFANEFFKNAVGTESLQDASLELRETLDSLHHIINSLKQQTAVTEISYPYARVAARPSLKSSEFPPIQAAVALIRQCEMESSEIAAWIREFFPMESFSGMCLHVYFSDQVSEADFIVVNVGLMYMFWDQGQRIDDPKERKDNDRHVEMLRGNLETALANLSFHLPATSTMICALLLGAFYAIEISKPSLSWTLMSKASELCQTLGYHRLSSMKNDKPPDAQRKQFLFWNTYFIDKSLSLRLGRASTIQDWDVTVPFPQPDPTNNSPLTSYIALWVATARCQGQIYELLFSPDAMVQSDDVRRFRAQRLVNDLGEISRNSKVLHVDLSLTRSRQQNNASTIRDKLGDYFLKYVIVSDDVLRLSLLTLIYRATPPPSKSTFVPECIDAARATLQRHQDCMDLLGKDNPIYYPSYVHWTLLFAPFIPFIVVFCQVIETQDQTDLARLHSFCTSMESSLSLSDAAAKTYRLFQVLYTIALRYVEFRTTTPTADQTQASAELNTYLAALGFPPAGLNNPEQQPAQMDPNAFTQPVGEMSMLDGTAGQRGANAMMWMGNTSQLGEWFNSNQQMMELLEEPSFTFPQ